MNTLKRYDLYVSATGAVLETDGSSRAVTLPKEAWVSDVKSDCFAFAADDDAEMYITAHDCTGRLKMREGRKYILVVALRYFDQKSKRLAHGTTRVVQVHQSDFALLGEKSE